MEGDDGVACYELGDERMESHPAAPTFKSGDVEEKWMEITCCLHNDALLTWLQTITYEKSVTSLEGAYETDISG